MVRGRCFGVRVMRRGASHCVVHRAMVDHFRRDERRHKPE